MDYEKTIDALRLRFTEKQDSTNQTHKAMQIHLHDIADALRGLQFTRKNPSGGDHGANVARAAAKVTGLLEVAEKKVAQKAIEVQASFDADLRKHSGLIFGPFAVEIRARVHAMKPSERVTVIQNAINTHDGATLAAVLDAPAILTGMSTEDLSKYREQFFKVAAPDLIKARDIYKDLVEHVQAAIATTMKAASEYSDPARLRALELQEAEAARAKASLGGE